MTVVLQSPIELDSTLTLRTLPLQKEAAQIIFMSLSERNANICV